jgi:endonuclease/exonuclease/phosphatase family metal-dependent hydrolase
LSGTVRLLTWNIHGALGRNRRFDLQRIVAQIRRHAPDIVALQEIDSRRPGEREIFGALLRALGAHGVDAKTIVTSDGDYGQALISRWPIGASEVRDISYPEREPRRAVRADIATPHGPLRVIATHLGLSAKERLSQMRELLRLIGTPSVTTVALGDFNDWLRVGSVRNVLGAVLPGQTRLRTFPSRLPLFSLDRIYCYPREALIDAFVDTGARSISDHLLLGADIDMSSEVSVGKPIL